MATIINNNDFTLSANLQSQIQNAAANAGVEKVIVSVRHRYDNAIIFDVYDEENNIVCSGDTDPEAEQIF